MPYFKMPELIYYLFYNYFYKQSHMHMLGKIKGSREYSRLTCKILVIITIIIIIKMDFVLLDVFKHGCCRFK